MMTLINFISTNIKEHPFTSGIISSATSAGFSIVGVLSQEGTVRLIGSVGGILGIALTLMSIYYKLKKEKK